MYDIICLRYSSIYIYIYTHIFGLYIEFYDFARAVSILDYIGYSTVAILQSEQKYTKF